MNQILIFYSNQCNCYIYELTIRTAINSVVIIHTRAHGGNYFEKGNWCINFIIEIEMI